MRRSQARQFGIGKGNQPSGRAYRASVCFRPIADVLPRTTVAGDMTRRMAAFGALFFTGPVAGAAFVIWIEFNPSGSSANYYTQSMQHAIRAFTLPLPSIVLL